MCDLMSKLEDNLLENWVEKELGLESLKQIRENPYINGEAKRILDYIFENLYNPEFSKVIDLNLALDQDYNPHQLKLSLSLNEADLEFVALKIRYLELKQEKFILEKKNIENDLEINIITKNIIENQSSKSSNENFNVLKKNMELMLTEDELDKKKLLMTKISNTTEQLNSFLAKKNIESTEKNDLDSFLKYNYTKECELNYQNLNLSKFADYFEFFDSKSKYEIVKLNQILDGQALKNEVDLLKYQNTSEFTYSNVLSLNDAINQELLNIIVLNSQSYQYETNKDKNDQKYEILLKILKKNRISKYYRDYLGLYGRYFKSYITLKKILCEFNQLYAIFEQLKSEKDFYRNSFLAISKRFDRIKNMELQIHKKHIEIEDILIENFSFFNQKFPLDLDKIKISWDQLIDIFRNYVSSNVIVNTSKNDSNCLSETRQNKIEQYKSSIYQLLNNNESKDDYFEIRIKLVEDLFSSKSYGKAKSFMMSIFYELFLDISSKIKSINKNKEQRISSHDIEISFRDLNNLLSDCNEVDKYQVVGFFDLMVEKIQYCEQNSNYMQELTNLVSKWFNQPAVHECCLENYTVNSKNLNYYTEFITELKEKL